MEEETGGDDADYVRRKKFDSLVFLLHLLYEERKLTNLYPLRSRKALAEQLIRYHVVHGNDSFVAFYLLDFGELQHLRQSESIDEGNASSESRVDWDLLRSSEIRELAASIPTVCLDGVQEDFEFPMISVCPGGLSDSGFFSNPPSLMGFLSSLLEIRAGHLNEGKATWFPVIEELCPLTAKIIDFFRILVHDPPVSQVVGEVKGIRRFPDDVTDFRLSDHGSVLGSVPGVRGTPVLTRDFLNSSVIEKSPMGFLSPITGKAVPVSTPLTKKVVGGVDSKFLGLLPGLGRWISSLDVPVFTCSWPVRSAEEKVVFRIVQTGFTRSDIECLPFGLSFPLLSAIMAVRRDRPAPLDVLRGTSDRKRNVSTISPSVEESLKKLFAASTPRELDVSSVTGANDVELVKSQQETLHQRCRTSFSSSTGRGAFLMRTCETPFLIDSLKVSPLSITGSCPNGITVTLNTDQFDEDFADWPEFHNGAAVALSLRFRDSDKASWHVGSSSSTLGHSPFVSRTWIHFNSVCADDGSVSDQMSRQVRNANAGILLAFGLQRQLVDLKRFDLFKLLRYHHEQTSVAVLLGVPLTFVEFPLGGRHPRGCVRVGRAQKLSIEQMLAIHIPLLLHQPREGIDYLGSRSEARGRELEDDGIARTDELCLEKYALTPVLHASALVGLGLFRMGTRDHRVVQVLLTELADSHPVVALSSGYALGCLLLRESRMEGSAKQGALQFVGPRLFEMLQGYIHGARYPSHEARVLAGVYSENVFHGCPSFSSSSRGVEGDIVCSSNHTAPGALIALALAFLKSNDAAVAASIDIPSTLSSLMCHEGVVLCLRVVARALVNWDSVSSSRAWLGDQVPRSLITFCLSRASNDRIGEMDDDDVLDEEVLLAHFLYIVAGASLSLGIRFAGSNSSSVYELLVECVECLEVMCTSTVSSGKTQMRSVNSDSDVVSTLHILARYHNVSILGSGDEELCRIILRLLDANSPFSTRMALNMALGFLFLSKCKATFDVTSNLAVFGLLAALYPIFPARSTDNALHLQPMRHFYVLAIVPRIPSSDSATTDADGVEDEMDLQKEFIAAALPGSSMDTSSSRPRFLPETQLFVRCPLLHAVLGQRLSLGGLGYNHVISLRLLWDYIRWLGFRDPERCKELVTERVLLQRVKLELLMVFRKMGFQAAGQNGAHAGSNYAERLERSSLPFLCSKKDCSTSAVSAFGPSETSTAPLDPVRERALFGFFCLLFPQFVCSSD